MGHLTELPKLCGMRKINEMVKRIRLNIINYCLITHMKSQMPMLWGHEKKQKQLMENLEEVYREVAHQYNLSVGDFPNVEEFRGKLQKHSMSSFPVADRKTLSVLSDMLSIDIPRIFKNIAGISPSNDKEGDHNDDDDENQNLKAMMNFDLNGPRMKESPSASIYIFLTALVFGVLIAVLAVTFQVGYLHEWVEFFKIAFEHAKVSAGLSNSTNTAV